MKKRLIWMASVLLAAVLYLFENNAGTLTVLVGALVVPGIGLLTLAGGKISGEIRLNEIPEKGHMATGTLTVTNRGILPSPRLRAAVSCRNLHTGEQTQTAVELSLLPKQRRAVPFSIDCPHCGRVEIRVTQIAAADLFGLFERQLPTGAGALFTIAPRLFEPAVLLESHNMAAPDSDAYSQVRPGGDPGEIYGIREYVPGDAIRSIHWKLSEKTGRTMVREFGLPVVHQAALLLEMEEGQTPEETDAMMEVFVSLSSALIQWDIRHRVFWRDGYSDELSELSVASGDELDVMLERLLETPPGKQGGTVRQFLRKYPHCPYAHVIVVGGRVPEGIRELYNGNRVSVLVLRRNAPPEGLQPDGTHVLSFTPDAYMTQLCRLEV